MLPRNKLIHRSPKLVRLASALTLLSLVTGLGGVAVALWSFIVAAGHPQLFIGLGLIGASTICIAGRAMAASHLNCGVCSNPVFKAKDCTKHPRAPRFLGLSYGVPIAAAALFVSRFRCMYCGEITPLSHKELKEKSTPVGQTQVTQSASIQPALTGNSLPTVGQSRTLPPAMPNQAELDQLAIEPPFPSQPQRGEVSPQPLPPFQSSPLNFPASSGVGIAGASAQPVALAPRNFETVASLADAQTDPPLPFGPSPLPS